MTESTLCASCKITPWGPSGWTDFHNRSSYFEHRKWQQDDPALLRFVSNTAPVETFYLSAGPQACAWCSLVLSSHDMPPSLEIAQQKYGIKDYQIDLEFCAPPGREPLRINVVRVLITAVPVSRQRRLMKWRGSYSVLARPRTPASRDFLAPRVTTYQGQEFDHGLAKWWMENCMGNHEGCNPRETGKEMLGTVEDARRNGGVQRPPPPTTNTPRLPTRVLQVLPDAQDGEKAMVLLRDSEDGETGTYACLSYTWGAERRHDFAKLAREMFRAGVTDPKITLPVVFADAAQVALKLGIDFLWIDALCIWQDDAEDKKQELSVMHRYYTEATVVVQTSATTSVDESFLGETRNSEVARMVRDAGAGEDDNRFIRVPYEWTDQTSAVVRSKSEGELTRYQHEPLDGTVRSLTGDYCDGIERPNDDEDRLVQACRDILFICPAEDLPYYDVESEPASFRGWIFQEQNLCRRLLIFPSNGGMIFRCDAHLWGRQDGNVNHYLPREPGPQLGRPPWGKKKVMYRQEFPRGVKFLPFNDRIMEMFEWMRKLAMLGKQPELTIKGNRVELTLDLGEELLAERQKMRKFWENISAQRSQYAIDGGREMTAFGGSDIEKPHPGQKRAPEATTDDDAVQRTMETADGGNGPGTYLHYFQPFSLSQEAFFADGTSFTRKFPPVDHPYLMMGHLDPSSPTYGKETMIATAPMPGHIFPSQLMNAWTRLVTDYCRRRLSYSKDKLVAMAALARKFEEWYGKGVLGEYHAGLWSRFIEEGMLWENAGKRRAGLAEGTAGYDVRAPSWSWASVRHARYHEPKLETASNANAFAVDFRVNSVVTTPAGDSPPNGAVEAGGFLKISGLLMEVWWMVGRNRLDEEVMLLYAADPHTNCGSSKSVSAFGGAIPDHERYHVATERNREQVILLLGRRVIGEGGHDEDHIAECLVLKSRECREANDFVRIGFATLKLLDFDQIWKPRFKQYELTLY